jgi:hypothetical protein
MRSTTLATMAAAAALLPAIPARGYGADLAVVSVSPQRHQRNALVSASIAVTFDQPVLPASIGPASFWAFGKWSGTVLGSYVFSNGDQTVTLVPQHKLFPGEQVMVILSHDIVAAAGPALRSAGYSWQFWTASAPAPALAYFALDAMTTRTVPEISTRSYGGVATDLDTDGWPDLTIVNEDTADLRVFMNLANGTGLYAPFLQPTFPIGFGSSPSEPADFNGDGKPDICVAEVGIARVGVLLGNGDGTYGPQQQIVVGSQPRGIAVLDADGDGDADIVNTNNGSSNLTIMFNDGNGVFGTATAFEGGAAGEWALAAADMNDDGILDLVIGARNSQTIIVRTGNGNGTFSRAGTQGSGGQTWMLVTGDLDGDGAVGILDFLALLAAWGPCPGPCPPFCPADVDFDCAVGITDFLALLGNWG